MIIIDTSVLIANLVSNDAFHTDAQKLMYEIASSGQPQAITYGTLLELSRGLNRLVGSESAARNVLIAFNSFEILFPDNVKNILNFYSEKNEILSYVDCEIIAIAKSMGAKVVSFDDNLMKTFRQ